MEIIQNDHNELLKNYYLDGVAVKDDGTISFITEQSSYHPDYDKHHPKTRLLVYSRDDHGAEQWRSETWIGLSKMNIAAITHPLSQVVVCDLDGFIYTFGNDFNRVGQIPNKHAIKNIHSIGGYAYVTGRYRYVAKLDDNNNWQELNNGIKVPNSREAKSIAGFDFIDGFSETEIYAAGAQGDLWQFNGEKWHQIPFPTDVILCSMCCGQDGFVYISTQNGMLFKGRNDEWRMVNRGKLHSQFDKMIWFQDRVWGTTGEKVWHVVDDKVIEVDLPSEVSKCAGDSIDCNDKTLVLSGARKAARFENGEWDILIDPKD